jgi:hypothetical protein
MLGLVWHADASNRWTKQCSGILQKIVRDKTFRHAHPHEDPAADPIELLGLISALAQSHTWLVSPDNADPHLPKRSIHRADHSSWGEGDLNVSAKVLSKAALDQTCAKSAPGWYLNRRSYALFPPKVEMGRPALFDAPDHPDHP